MHVIYIKKKKATSPVKNTVNFPFSQKLHGFNTQYSLPALQLWKE